MFYFTTKPPLFKGDLVQRGVVDDACPPEVLT